MVLFQIFMNGYTTVNGVQRIQGTSINPFRGKCRITFLNYNMYFTTTKSALLRVDSNELYGNDTYKFNIIVPLDSSVGIGLSKTGYHWETYLTSPTITIDIVELNQDPGSLTPIPNTVFNQCLFSFDIEELDKN